MAEAADEVSSQDVKTSNDNEPRGDEARESGTGTEHGAANGDATVTASRDEEGACYTCGSKDHRAARCPKGPYRGPSFRTQPCKFFFNGNNCQKGSDCNFSHDPSILNAPDSFGRPRGPPMPFMNPMNTPPGFIPNPGRGARPPRGMPFRPPMFGGPMGFDGSTGGMGPSGGPMRRPSMGTVRPATPYDRPPRPTRGPCKYFFEFKNCKWGDSCNFSHDLKGPQVPVGMGNMPQPGPGNASSAGGGYGGNMQALSSGYSAKPGFSQGNQGSGGLSGAQPYQSGAAGSYNAAGVPGYGQPQAGGYNQVTATPATTGGYSGMPQPAATGYSAVGAQGYSGAGYGTQVPAQGYGQAAAPATAASTGYGQAAAIPSASQSYGYGGTSQTQPGATTAGYSAMASGYSATAGTASAPQNYWDATAAQSATPGYAQPTATAYGQTAATGYGQAAPAAGYGTQQVASAYGTQQPQSAYVVQQPSAGYTTAATQYTGYGTTPQVATGTAYPAATTGYPANYGATY